MGACWRPLEKCCSQVPSNHLRKGCVSLCHLNLPFPYHYRVNNNQLDHHHILVPAARQHTSPFRLPPSAALILPSSTLHLFVLLVLKWLEAITYHAFYFISCVSSSLLKWVMTVLFSQWAALTVHNDRNDRSTAALLSSISQECVATCYIVAVIVSLLVHILSSVNLSVRLAVCLE